MIFWNPTGTIFPAALFILKTPNFEDDLENVIERAFANHVEKIIITGSTLQDSKEVLEEALKNENLFITVFINIISYHAQNGSSLSN